MALFGYMASLVIIGSIGITHSQLAHSFATEASGYDYTIRLTPTLATATNTLGDSDLGDLGDSCWNASQIQGFLAFPPGIFIFLHTH